MHEISHAARLLQEGELVALPTETVYGLGANALDSSAVAKIFATKGRPSDNPLIVHVASLDAARPLLMETPPLVEQLASAFWPGPLTVVLPFRADCGLSPLVTCGLTSVGIRVPNHPVALALLQAAAVPVAAPSANKSGSPSPTTAAHVISDFPEICVLDGGPCAVGLESTVVKILVDGPPVIRILRPGKISARELEKFAPVQIGYSEVSTQISPEAPGMKYKHYAPKAEVFLVSEASEIPEAADSDAVLIAFDDLVCDRNFVRLSLGGREDLEEASRRLFGLLRRCDDLNAREVFIDVRFDRDLPGIGQALWNRIYKASTKI